MGSIDVKPHVINQSLVLVDQFPQFLWCHSYLLICRSPTEFTSVRSVCFVAVFCFGMSENKSFNSSNSILSKFRSDGYHTVYSFLWKTYQLLTKRGKADQSAIYVWWICTMDKTTGSIVGAVVNWWNRKPVRLASTWNSFVNLMRENT